MEDKVTENKVTESNVTPEAVMEAIQNGELSGLLDRVKNAQVEIAKMKNQQTPKLSAAEVAAVTSVIIHDMIHINGSFENTKTRKLIKQVLHAAIKQHGRLLEVDFDNEK